MSRSRPITGAAAGDHDRYRENYDRIFAGPKRRVACEGCGAPLARFEVGLCAGCIQREQGGE